MTLEEKIEHWLDIAEYDLETAAAMQNSARYLYTVFMCQQAKETTQDFLSKTQEIFQWLKSHLSSNNP